MNTIRQQIIILLKKNEQGIRELSQLVGQKEAEIRGHLPHIKRSMEAQKRTFKMTPAKCLKCGYEFKSRRRLSAPGRCPLCKDSHIQDPYYRIL